MIAAALAFLGTTAGRRVALYAGAAIAIIAAILIVRATLIGEGENRERARQNERTIEHVDQGNQGRAAGESDPDRFLQPPGERR